MNTDYRYFGCTGGSCPKQENCARYLERGTEERPYTFHTPPFNHYNDGERLEFRCGWQEYSKKDED